MKNVIPVHTNILSVHPSKANAETIIITYQIFEELERPAAA
jgi:hypothetical protein